MKNKFFETVADNNLIDQGETVLIALSGGADSMALLYLLLELRDRLNLHLKAAHVEHGIRGEESLSDCKFVEAVCRKEKIECCTLHMNAPAEAKTLGMGLEEYSRQRRYDFFESVACDKIATAHNLSDNVETILFRLSRGTSLKGMCGIPVKRGKIIRPLIHCTSSEIRAFCSTNQIPYVSDSTNQSNDYSRNYIRNVIVPAFEKMNPSFEQTANRFIEAANIDETFLDGLAQSAFSFCCHQEKLDLKRLRESSQAVIRRVLLKYSVKNGFYPNDYQLHLMLELTTVTGRRQLKDNIFIVSDGNHLRFARLHGANAKFHTEFVKYSYDNFLNIRELLIKEIDFYCDYDKINGCIGVRTRAEEDRISPSGRNCSKSLKKLFNEKKIPFEKRNDIPVIYDESGIIGVAGICCDERVRIDSGTKNILTATIRSEDNE